MEITNEVKEINAQYQIASASKMKFYEEKMSWDEYFYSNVDDTLTQFTKKQVEEIKQKYDILISTKYCFAIVDQFIATLTGTKPTPHLISTQDSTADFTENLTRAFQGTWTESDGPTALRRCIQDMVVTGSGYLMPRRSHFYNECTFNVLIDYIRWQQVMVDPNCQREDLEDAEFIFITQVLTKTKAEKMYDISIGSDAAFSEFNPGFFGEKVVMFGGFDYNYDNTNDHKYVWVRNRYVKKELNVYIGDTGVIGNKKPIPTEIPNPRKIAFQTQIQELEANLKQLDQTNSQNVKVQKDLNEDNTEFQSEQDFTQYQKDQVNMSEEHNETQQASQEQIDQLTQLHIQASQMPDSIPAYILTNMREEEYIIQSYSRMPKIYIQRTLLVGNKIIEEEILPIDKYPIVHFAFQHQHQPDHTFGMIHKIQDLEDGMNKAISAMIYDLQMTNRPKYFVTEETFIANNEMERTMSIPGAIVKYVVDPNDKYGGVPQKEQLQSLNPAITQLLQIFQQTIQFITGIDGLNQSDPSQQTNSAGNSVSFQDHGNQRVKSYARTVENGLSKLANVTIGLLLKFMPKDKALMYLNDDNEKESITLQSGFEDLDYKVRVDIISSLPSMRSYLIDKLSFIVQTTQDEGLRNILTEELVKTMDLPEKKAIVEKIDVVHKKDAELQQCQQQLEEQTKQVNILLNQIQQLKASKVISEVKANAEQNMNEATLKHQHDLDIQALSQQDVTNSQPQYSEEDIL